MSAASRVEAQRTVRGMLWTMYGRGAGGAVQLLVLLVLARLLSPREFGVVSAAMVIIGLAAIFSQLGLGPALVQRLELEPRHLETAFTTTLLLGVGLAGATVLLAPTAASFFGIPQVTPVLRVLAVLFPLRALGTVSESLLQRELKFRWLANLDVATYATGYIVAGIGLALLGFGVWALVAANVVQVASRTLALRVIRPHASRLRVERLAFRELLSFGGGFTIARVANYVALQGDNLVVGRWLGAEALGLYGRAYQLMATPASSLGEALDAVLFPTLARAQTERDRLATAYRRAVAVVALAMLPVSAVCAILAPELVTVALGPRWSGVIVPFQILALGMLLRTSYRLSDAMARATGAVYRRAWRQATYAVLVVGGAWIGQRWGIPAVAAFVLGALLANFLAMADLSLSLTRLSWRSFWRAHLPAVRVTAVLGGVAWALAAVLRAWVAPPAALLAAEGLTIAALGVAIVRWLPGVLLGADGVWALSVLDGLVPPRLRVYRRRALVTPVSGS